MAKGTGTYDDPILVDGLFTKTINGVKKFFKLNGSSSSVDHATTSRGQIAWFAQPEVPNGYLVCNGANVSRETYADLFAVIGTTFGEGDGSSTYTLPNLIDKFAQGSTIVGTVKSAGLPNITGILQADRNFVYSYITSGAIICNNKIPSGGYGLGWNETIEMGGCEISIDASKSNSIYGNSTTVQPPALTLLPCIKY